jgi:DNA sulfur modification protein DndC
MEVSREGPDVKRAPNGKLYQLVHGPYKQSYREELLRGLLEAQKEVHAKAPENIKFDLFTIEDLQEIRRIWMFEKHEIEDSVPRIYEDVMGKPYPEARLDENQVFDAGDIEILREITKSEDDPEQLHFHLVRQLLAVEGKYQHAARRAGLFDELNAVLENHAFKDENEALDFAVLRSDAIEEAKKEMEYEFVQRVISITRVDVADTGMDADAELSEEQ